MTRSFKHIMKGRTVNIGIKKALCESITVPTMMFVSETWTWNEGQIIMIQAVGLSYMRGACDLHKIDGNSNANVYGKYSLSVKGEGMSYGVAGHLETISPPSASAVYIRSNPMPQTMPAPYIYGLILKKIIINRNWKLNQRYPVGITFELWRAGRYPCESPSPTAHAWASPGVSISLCFTEWRHGTTKAYRWRHLGAVIQLPWGWGVRGALWRRVTNSPTKTFVSVLCKYKVYGSCAYFFTATMRHNGGKIHPFQASVSVFHVFAWFWTYLGNFWKAEKKPALGLATGLQIAGRRQVKEINWQWGYTRWGGCRGPMGGRGRLPTKWKRTYHWNTWGTGSKDGECKSGAYEHYQLETLLS